MITLNQFKQFLKIDLSSTSQDAVLNDYKNRAAGELNNLTNRTLSYAVVTEYYTGDGSNKIRLRNWPAYTPTAIEVLDVSNDYVFNSIFEGDDNCSNSLTLLTETGELYLKKGYIFSFGYKIKIVYPAGYVAGDDWITAADYIAGDYAVNNSRLYKCLITHTSGTFADDLTALKWELASELAAPGELSKAHLYLSARMYYESPEGKDYFMKDTETKSRLDMNEITKIKDIDIKQITSSYRRINV